MVCKHNFLKPGEVITCNINTTTDNYFYLDGILVASSTDAALTYQYPAINRLWFSYDYDGYWRSCSDCKNDDSDGHCSDCTFTCTGRYIYCYTSAPSGVAGATKVEIVNTTSDPVYVYNYGQ